ncbi:MAG: hypothetical protein GXO77_00255, partial [Calditrichaeota bacterium]|nr:hypothetical protein [Calditrichota bacterium]
MIKRITLRLLFLILSALLFSCAGQSRLKKTPVLNKGLTLSKLLAQYPAKNDIQQDFLNQAIMSMDADSLKTICLWLNSADSLKRTRAQYALHGVSLDFELFPEQQKEKYFKAITAAAPLLKSAEAKQFLLEQAEFTKDDRILPLIERFFKQRRLYEPALRALKHLNSKQAEKATLRLLDQSQGQQQIDLIQLCAEKGIVKSIPKLRKLLKTDDPKLHRAALKALARLGDTDIEEQIRDNPETYLQYAGSLFGLGKTARAKSIILELLKDKEKLPRCNLTIRALKILKEIDLPLAFKSAEYKYLNNLKNPECRKNILYATAGWSDSLSARTWDVLLKSANFNTRL